MKDRDSRVTAPQALMARGPGATTTSRPETERGNFTGFRRSELVREYAEDQVLRWEGINWQKNCSLSATVAKQTSRKMGNRRFIPMEAALLHWLNPYRKERGLLIPMVDAQLDDQ